MNDTFGGGGGGGGGTPKKKKIRDCLEEKSIKMSPRGFAEEQAAGPTCAVKGTALQSKKTGKKRGS